MSGQQNWTRTTPAPLSPKTAMLLMRQSGSAPDGSQDTIAQVSGTALIAGLLGGVDGAAQIFTASGATVESALGSLSLGLANEMTARIASETSIQSQVTALQGSVATGATPFATWAALSATTGTANAVAIVPSTDTGTHTDPVVGGTVPNGGTYKYVTGTPSGWQRIFANQSDFATTAAGLAATTNGQYFAVTAGANLVSVYLNSAGSAVFQRTLATSGALAATTGASLIGLSQAIAYSSGTIGSHMNQTPFVTDAPYNADASGTTDCTTAINAAQAAGPIRFGKGIYLISSNITISVNATFEPGAVLSIATGVVVSFTDNLIAGRYTIFTGAGTVNCRNAWLFDAFPEWWGAKPSNSAFDSTASIQAALNASWRVRLLPAKYYIGSGQTTPGLVLLNMPTSHQQLIGAGPQQTTANGCTELVINSPNASAIFLGQTTNPGGSGIDNWTEGSRLEGFAIRRNVSTYPLQNPAVGPTGGGTGNSPCGVIMKYAAVCYVENVYTIEHTMGMYLTDTVACRIINTRHLRYTSGTSLGNDFFIGIYLDNSSASPFNSGNASVYILGGGAFSNEAAGNSYTYSGGVKSYQGFTDTYIIGFETANCGYGADMYGRQSTAADYQTEDLIISQCVFDGCRWDAVHVALGGPTTAIQVTNNYLEVSNATGPLSNAIHFENIHGSAVASNNQCLALNGNPARGLFVETSSGIISTNNIYTDISNPVVVSNGTVFMVQDQINVSVVPPNTAAVAVTSSSYGKIDCNIIVSTASLTPSIPIGVDLIGSGNSHIEVNCTNIYTPGIVGGAANKLVNNGTQITTAGSFGTNCLATGIMA